MSEFSNSSWDGKILCLNLVTLAGMCLCKGHLKIMVEICIVGSHLFRLLV